VRRYWLIWSAGKGSRGAIDFETKAEALGHVRALRTKPKRRVTYRLIVGREIDTTGLDPENRATHWADSEGDAILRSG
jgi:hypothetical protein